VEKGISYIGPHQVRTVQFAGLWGRPKVSSAVDRAKALEAARKLDVMWDRETGLGRHIVFSEDNILGNIRRNLKAMAMYPNLIQNLEVMGPALEKVDVFYLSIRPLEDWWNSCLSFAIQHFRSPPSSTQLSKIAHNTSGWQTVIKTFHDAFPKAQVKVLEFGAFTGFPAH